MAPTAPATGADSIRAKTIPPKPSAANRPPGQSNWLPLVAALLSGTFHRVSNRTASPSGKIDEEHPSPRTVLGEPSAQHGTDGGGDRREAGPRPDGAAALLLGEIGADQSQAAGDQQRAAYSLEAPGNNQLPDVGRQSAPGRGCGEEHDAGGEDLAAAVQVSQRPADEEQRRQEERVRFHHPLNVRQGRMQGRLQRRQRHVHDRAVDERHARTEDGRG